MKDKVKNGMTRAEVATLLKKVQTHYSSLDVDSFMLDEWYNELKNYDGKEVYQKLDQHLRSEQYGMNIPKLYFLTKYLKTADQKKNQTKGQVQCRFCDKFVGQDEFDQHYQKCSRINYVLNQSEKYGIDIKSSLDTTENVEKAYDYIVEQIKERVSKSEQGAIGCVMNVDCFIKEMGNNNETN